MKAMDCYLIWEEHVKAGVSTLTAADIPVLEAIHKLAWVLSFKLHLTEGPTLKNLSETLKTGCKQKYLLCFEKSVG